MVAPAKVIDTPTTEADAVPVLVMVRLSTGAVPVAHPTTTLGEAWPLMSAATRFCDVTETWAELDDEPKIPNTKPPIATAAIRVTAMISTVAMIGEMAFRVLCFPFRIFIVERSELGSV